MRTGFLLVLMTLAACARPDLPEQPATPRPGITPVVDVSGACNAVNYADLAGQPVEELEKVLILGPVRVIRPGTAVTMDFIAERINFGVNADGVIERISCG